jgi:hypothetical protein
MRLINALMRTQIETTEKTKLDAYLKHYGGYQDGLASGSSNNTSNPSTATLDLAEFFQVALSAVRNKETDAAQTAINGLVDRETINNAAVFWEEYDSTNGIMTGFVSVSNAEHFTEARAMNKSTTCILNGANNFIGSDRTRLQLKPITKLSRILGVEAGGVLHADYTVDVWGTSLYSKYTANTSALKVQLQYIDFIDTNSTTLVARRYSDNKLFIISVNGSFSSDIQTTSDLSLFITGSANSWWYLNDIIKVYSNKSVFIAVKSDYSTITFGDYLDNGGFITPGFDMLSVTSQISGYTDFHRNFIGAAATHNSMFLKYFTST